MFINELRLYIDYFRNLKSKIAVQMTTKEAEHFTGFRKNLEEGIECYRNLESHFFAEADQAKEEFLLGLRHS